jgi:ABC-2 type transport system permease protein
VAFFTRRFENNMIALIEKTLRKNIFTLIIYSTISATFVWMYVAFYPSIAKESETLKEAFKAYPQELFQAFNIEIETFISSFEGFIAAEHFSIIWPIVLAILIISYASASIAGEIDKGTIDLLLAQPISRLKIFLAKYFSGLFLITTFILLSNFSVVPFALLHNVDLRIQNYLTISVLGFFFALAILGICILVSSFSSSRGRPAAVTGGVLIVMYALNIFSTFQESVEFLKYASFFHYFDYKTAVVDNQINLLNLLVLSTVGVVTAVIAAIIFIKRDIATT